MAYLAPLILQTIITAEQAIITSPELDPDPEISLEHVRSALAVRNEDPIGDLLAFRKKWTPDDGVLKRAAKDGGLVERSTVLDEYELPFRDIAVLSTGPDAAAEAEDAPNGASGDDEVDAVDDWDDLSSTLSDEEDEELDAALDVMDAAYDELCEHRLWEGHKGGAQVEDWLDPWDERKLPKGASADSTELLSAVEARREGACMSGPVLTPAEYIAALDETNKSRRWRRSILHRSTRMPTQRLKSQAMKYRLHKSAPEVIDSEEDGEE